MHVAFASDYLNSGVRDHCPNTTREQNPCVAGFTALVSEFREQLAAANSSKYITAAMPYTPVNYEFEYDKIKVGNVYYRYVSSFFPPSMVVDGGGHLRI